MILSNSAHLQLLLALAGFSLLTSAAHPAPAPKTALSPATSTSLPAPGPTSARLLAKRKKSNDESMSLVTTQITIWNRPDLKAFPSADAKNAAWLDMRKAKKVNQYPWRAGALITANSTITSKGKTLTYNEKIYNQTSKFEDKVTVIDQEKSTIRIDELTCKLKDSDDDDDANAKPKVSCTLVQQSGTADAVTITPKPDANIQLKMNAKFQATVYDQMPDKVAKDLTSLGASASSAADRWEEKYGTFSYGGGSSDD